VRRESTQLLDALRDAAHLRPDVSWESLIRRARRTNLLGTLAARLRAAGVFDRVPARPREHLVAAETLCAAQRSSVVREVRAVAEALAGLHVPVVLLKGAAYLLADLPAARGRMFSDIDILVPKRALAEVESALMLAGFATTHHHPHDQRYYREWMHEIPPMQHVKRSTTLDVHYTIVPTVAGVMLDPAELFGCALPLGERNLHLLCPTDMILHSATHLFRNEDFTHGLRDLVDIDALLRHFAADPAFWNSLVERAQRLDLGRPLYYALRYAARILGTPVPGPVMADAARFAPSAPLRRLMDALFTAALETDATHLATRVARQALYVRGHWLCMPLPLLAWHLGAKAFRREQPA
jgi:hypothetical protein